MDFARNERGFCVGFAWNLIFFSFVREREGYKHHADCTVNTPLDNTRLTSAFHYSTIKRTALAHSITNFLHS